MPARPSLAPSASAGLRLTCSPSTVSSSPTAPGIRRSRVGSSRWRHVNVVARDCTIAYVDINTDYRVAPELAAAMAALSCLWTQERTETLDSRAHGNGSSDTNGSN